MSDSWEISRQYYEQLQRRLKLYEDALRKICNSEQCPWTAAAMFQIADCALKGSTPSGEVK